ncbi:hypothetical protein GEMRC1_009583 [Eukaryota sp. GEM-RC1]
MSKVPLYILNVPFIATSHLFALDVLQFSDKADDDVLKLDKLSTELGHVKNSLVLPNLAALLPLKSNVSRWSSTVGMIHSLSIPNAYCFPSDCFCNNLYSLQSVNLLADAVIAYDGNSFHCHSFVVSAFSPVLKEKGLESTTIEFSHLPFLTDYDIFFSVLTTLYGQSLTVTPENFTNISSLLLFFSSRS